MDKDKAPCFGLVLWLHKTLVECLLEIVSYYCRGISGFLKLGEVEMRLAAAARRHLLFCKNLGGPAPQPVMLL